MPRRVRSRLRAFASAESLGRGERRARFATSRLGGLASFSVKHYSQSHKLTENYHFQLRRRRARLPREADDVEHARQHIAKDGRRGRVGRIEREESENTHSRIDLGTLARLIRLEIANTLASAAPSALEEAYEKEYSIPNTERQSTCCSRIPVTRSSLAWLPEAIVQDPLWSSSRFSTLPRNGSPATLAPLLN